MKKYSARKKKDKATKAYSVALLVIATAILMYLIIQLPFQLTTETAGSERLPKVGLFENATIQIKQDDYFAYPLTLYQNQTIKAYISTEDKINTLFLTSLQFEQYKNLTAPSFKSIRYFVDASFWGVRNADFSFTAPEDDTYYLLIGKKALIQEQSPLSGDSRVRILVYGS